MPLRDYQKSAIDSIVLADMEGCKRQLITMPTGTGKTACASNLPAAIGLPSWETMAFIVAQEELAWQALESLKAFNPELRVTLEKAEHHGDENADIVVASVDTLARSEARLSAFARLPLRVIFLDECHAAVSPKYLKVLRELRVLKGEDDIDEKRLLIGLTATVRRADGIGLDRVFDKIVFRRSIEDMVKAGWTASPIAYRVETEASLDGIHMRDHDFAVGELSRAVNTPEQNALVIEKYREYGAGLPFIGFTVDIQHSEDLAQTFRDNGIECEAISSNTPKQRRKDLVEAHRKMELPGLISCQALLQGFDSPPATVALFDRPTCSGLLYQQAVGRVMRPFPAPERLAAGTYDGYRKQHSIIIDFVAASSQHRLYTASTLFGLSPQFDFEGRSIMDAMEDIRELERLNPTLDVSADFPGMEGMLRSVTQVDLWKPAPIPKLAKSCSQFVWTQAGQDIYRMSVPGMEVFIEVDLLGKYDAWRHADEGGPDMRLRFSQPEDAFAYADSLIPDEVVKLVRAKARWRKDPPTDKQCYMLWRNDPTVRNQFTSGDAFYWFSKNRFDNGNLSFSRGSLSLRIDMAVRKKVRAA
jgi:ATP-dependent helicase IRC3